MIIDSNDDPPQGPARPYYYLNQSRSPGPSESGPCQCWASARQWTRTVPGRAPGPIAGALAPDRDAGPVPAGAGGTGRGGRPIGFRVR